MTTEAFVVIAILVMAGYVLSMDKKPKYERVKSKEEIMAETAAMYEESTARINAMYEDARKRLKKIDKEFSSNSKIKK